MHAVKFLFPTQKLLRLPNFSSSSCRPFDTWCGPLRGHTAHFENSRVTETIAYRNFTDFLMGTALYERLIFISTEMMRGCSMLC